METIKLGLIILLLLSNVFSQEVDGEKRREGIGAHKWPNSAAIQDLLVKMNKKTKHQFFKGKLGSGKTQTARKRHKFQTFVGLMGKRNYDYQGVL